MPRSIRLGYIAGLDVRARPFAFVAFALMWVAFSALGIFALDLSPFTSLWGGFTGAVLQYASELWHHLGHAVAARRTGYPMSGITFLGPLALSRYPANEGELSGKIHIQRALGGPVASAILTVITGLLLLAQSNAPQGVAYWLTLITFVDNLLVFTLGAFLPLGFTDGSTLLHWWGKP